MTKYLNVSADCNDADYVSAFTEITDQELAQIEPLIEAIKNFKPYNTVVNDYAREHRHNFPIGECLRDDLGEKRPEQIYDMIDPEVVDRFTYKFMPCSDYGAHTIKSIEVYEVSDVKKLL